MHGQNDTPTPEVTVWVLSPSTSSSPQPSFKSTDEAKLTEVFAPATTTAVVIVVAGAIVWRVTTTAVVIIVVVVVDLAHARSA